MPEGRERETIRCDDIFVDSNAFHFEKICRIIKKYGFRHIVGITPLGEGSKIWSSNRFIWKLPILKTGFANRYILKMTGEKCIGVNSHLMEVLNSEFNTNRAIPALHGLHHFKYETLDEHIVWKELSTGKELMKDLFNSEINIFSPPFNSWNRRTEIVCNSLGLSIDHCFIEFDSSMRDMNSGEIEQLAKSQSLIPEVLYHPHLVSLEKLEIYMKTKRKYC